ncbi:MAG: Flp family type IVb pilin [Bdellovibrionota bacterium]
MLSTAIKKFFGATLSRLRRDERGQTIVEYILVIAVVIGVIFVLARPIFGNLQTKIGDSLKAGFFSDDPTGGKFYYFNVK